MTDAPPTPKNSLRERLASGGRPALGTFCSLADSTSAEIIASSGFDFVVVDVQHGGPTMDSLATLLPAIQHGGAASLVRVAWNDPALLMRALDLGADGVIVPMVSTAADAELAVSACRYPPEGLRSFGQIRGTRYGSTASTNEQVLCVVIIETAEGLENIDAIAATPGIDGILIGPIDLTLSLGLELDFTLSSPPVVRALEQIVEAGEKHGCAVGLPIFGSWMAESALQAGYKFLTVGGDSSYIRAGAAADVSAIHKLMIGEQA